MDFFGKIIFQKIDAKSFLSPTANQKGVHKPLSQKYSKHSSYFPSSNFQPLISWYLISELSPLNTTNVL